MTHAAFGALEAGIRVLNLSILLRGDNSGRGALVCFYYLGVQSAKGTSDTSRCIRTCGVGHLFLLRNFCSGLKFRRALLMYIFALITLFSFAISKSPDF